MKTKMHLNASPRLFARAKALRENPTKAEEKLWQYLRGKQTGYKYRRQHPLDNYVVDFFCHALKFVIEVDGSIHAEPINQLEDQNKDIDLEAKGYFIQRFTNESVLEHIDEVMIQIYRMQDHIRSILIQCIYDEEED